MEELGFSGSKGVSPVGVSGPFSLFSAEAVHQMRKGVLNPEMGKNVNCEDTQRSEPSIHIGPIMRQGVDNFRSRAPLVDNAPKSPETLEIVSIIAGVNLVTAMDFEIGHINFSMSSEED
ncbi:hypothetical protein PDIG_01140 [Penicillium digitatum PHI26]|uniref:Uncharacterized protein n=2 Tax=Penicillium digitatum TaxID=36651 RepID=K9GYQ7_PEND2|nr:hypothetical protein PDIP_12460 [Penicillium digitatum Pd1]EKV19773.1 hypothetical protein PDIG_01140 [Penicillium digitatum PHI26]EKV20837.1 hypothetical protein PDIP_12460 [Penicillium digitatum Pd1]